MAFSIALPYLASGDDWAYRVDYKRKEYTISPSSAFSYVSTYKGKSMGQQDHEAESTRPQKLREPEQRS